MDHGHAESDAVRFGLKLKEHQTAQLLPSLTCPEMCSRCRQLRRSMRVLAKCNIGGFWCPFAAIKDTDGSLLNLDLMSVTITTCKQ